MSNVIDFDDMLNRLRAGESGGPMRDDTETIEGPMEYRLHDVLLALTWAALTQRRGLARKLWTAVVASDFDDWILLTPELGQAVDEADRSLAAFGRSSS